MSELDEEEKEGVEDLVGDDLDDDIFEFRSRRESGRETVETATINCLDISCAHHLIVDSTRAIRNVM
jgi:hypothetical protein